MALNMNKTTKEKIESLSDYFVTEMIEIIQKAIDKKVDELDLQPDEAERKREIQTTVKDMVNDGDISVSLDWS
tara:strand:+ start:741 stop:959 length:219 start_codon:yes stop_codon:yes gene_type:complete